MKKFSTLDASGLELKDECKEMSLLPVLCLELPHAVPIFPQSRITPYLTTGTLLKMEEFLKFRRFKRVIGVAGLGWNGESWSYD